MRRALCTRFTYILAYILASLESSSFPNKRVPPYWHYCGQLCWRVRGLVKGAWSSTSERLVRRGFFGASHQKTCSRAVATRDL
ncbi:hypothetical protein M0804_014843 [Polistes exclamans]|nr:hypothetical protein M0804_014843 [Polistes exclamans]